MKLASIKRNETINRLVRPVSKRLYTLMNSISRKLLRWNVSGTVPLKVHGTQFYMYSKCDDHLVNNLYYKKHTEDSELLLWSKLCTHALQVFDIGSNTGLYSIITALKNPKTNVVAFEPNPANHKRLLKNLSLNGIAKVQVIKKAVGNSNRPLTFTVPEDDSISLVSSAVGDFSRSFFDIKYKDIEVEQITIDAYCTQNELNQVDLMKIDVEYFELEVLQGAEQILREQGPNILMETFLYDVLEGNKPNSGSLKNLDKDKVYKVQELLQRHNYCFYAIGELGILKVNNLYSNPDGTKNYLVTKNNDLPKYIPYWNDNELKKVFS